MFTCINTIAHWQYSSFIALFYLFALSIYIESERIKMYGRKKKNLYTIIMLGCFNPSLGQKWTGSNIGLKR